MNIQEIYELGIEQGWDEADAFHLATIAWAESKGDPMAMEFIEENPLKSQYSFGIWQINLQHVPHLMAAGIGDWTSNTGGDLSDPELEAAINDPDSHANIINHIREVLSDPVTNAQAAEYVGHRRDYSEPLDDWDWTRWRVTELPMNDANHPGNFGAEITRQESDFGGVAVPTEFSGPIMGTKEWQEWVEANGWDAAAQDAALQYMYGQFQEGGYENVNSWLMEAKDVEVYKALDAHMTSLQPDPYVPSSMGQLPEGWISFWGDDAAETDPAISKWFNDWVKIFEENREEGVTKYLWDDLKKDFLADLDKQGWWNTKRTAYTDLARLWYSGGGPGGGMIDGDWVQGAGLDLPLVDSSAVGTDYQGTGDWKHIWNQTKEVVARVLQDFDDQLVGPGLTTHINKIAWKLMREGQASEFYLPTDTWSDTATQIIERYADEHFYDENGDLLSSVQFVDSTGAAVGTGAGGVQDIVDTLRTRANSQLYDIEDSMLKRWALEIKTEKGPNLQQRMAQIDAEAYSSWGLTTEQIDGMGRWAEHGSPGGSVSELVNPLWTVANKQWDDAYRKDDPWLMDNYRITDDDTGVTRFRTVDEMRRLARRNLDRFQNSDEFQSIGNQFIAGATSMFRSDYV